MTNKCGRRITRKYPSKTAMTKTPSKIRFTTKLVQPAEVAKGDAWTFLNLPKEASAKHRSRGMTKVEGILQCAPSFNFGS